MFKNVWGRIPCGFRERPFDVYTALLLIIVGFYGLLDPTFPELQEDTINVVIINVTALYMIVAGLVIISAIFLGKRSPVFSYYGEMYGWIFMASASLTVGIFQIYNALVTETTGIQNAFLFWIVFFVWLSLTIVAVIRSLDMYVNIKGVR
jgi:hypothetical protein